jgi:ATP/maltotriose-dependent transcriptional regulator MalT
MEFSSQEARNKRRFAPFTKVYSYQQCSTSFAKLFTQTGVGLLKSRLGKRLKELTEREHELLQIICRGLSRRTTPRTSEDSGIAGEEDSKFDPVPSPPEKNGG